MGEAKIKKRLDKRALEDVGGEHFNKEMTELKGRKRDTINVRKTEEGKIDARGGQKCAHSSGGGTVEKAGMDQDKGLTHSMKK